MASEPTNFADANFTDTNFDTTNSELTSSDPSNAESTEASTEASTETSTASETAEAVPAAAKRTPRKRGTASRSRAKKAADTAVEPEGGVAEGGATTDEAAQGGASETTDPAPARRTRRSRSKAAAASPEASAPVDTDQTDEVDTDQTDQVDTDQTDQADTDQTGQAANVDTGQTGQTGQTDEVADESIEDEARAQDEDEAETEDEPSAGAAASFGLLFQAPEPVAPRRRRATSAAGAPAAREEQAHTSAQEGSSGRGDTDSAADRADDMPADSTDTTEQTETTSSESTSSEDNEGGSRRSRRRGGRGRRARAGDQDSGGEDTDQQDRGGSSDQDADTGSTQDSSTQNGSEDRGDDSDGGSSRRRRRRRRGSDGDSEESRGARARDEVTSLKGSTRLEAKKQRRREGREAGRRRQVITEAEFLARRESVERVMVVRERATGKGQGRQGQENQTQIGVLEDGVLVEHYVSRETNASMIGNVYLGRVQNVLPSMEAAFVDVGKGRNAVLYAGEVNWDAAGLEGNMPKRIENALTSGDTVLVQVTKDPIGHKGARLTSQVSLPGRFLVYVPEASITGISRKLPDTERSRLKAILKKIVPDDAGVIVRTAAEGASEEELTADIARLTKAWDRIKSKSEKAAKKKGGAPVLLHGEPDLTVKVIRDVFNEDFTSLVVSGDTAWDEVSEYLEDVAPELAKRLTKWTDERDVFAQHRIDEQLAKALDRKVWLPSGGSLVIDRTEAMTVVDVNTGKFVGSGGNLEETVTKNNIEAAEEIVRQLRLRDIGGIIVIDFIDMVLESNRDLVVRRLLECLGRDRTKHQVAEVTSLGLVQMTRKRVGSGLLEVFSEPCVHCNGRGLIVHSDPVEQAPAEDNGGGRGRGRGRGGSSGNVSGNRGGNGTNRGNDAADDKPGSGPTAAQIAAAAHAAAIKAVAAAASGEGSDEEAAGEIAADAADAAVAEVTGEQPAAEETTDQSTEPTTDDGDPRDAAGATHTPEQSETPADQGVDAAAEPTESVDPAPVQPVSEPVATRPRRRRGRVVAQAGPPGQAEVKVLPAGQ